MSSASLALPNSQSQNFTTNTCALSYRGVSQTRIIVGAGGESQPGWTSLEASDLDIRAREQWIRLFVPGSVQAVLAEHVLEHLTPSEAEQAARNIYEILAPGGYCRIAVPDANNPSRAYQDWCRPNGPGQRMQAQLFSYPPHFVHYNLDSLANLLTSAGFHVTPLEWHDDAGIFHHVEWSDSSGAIQRSWRKLYAFISWLWAGCFNISLIVDAVKA